MWRPITTYYIFNIVHRPLGTCVGYLVVSIVHGACTIDGFAGQRTLAILVYFYNFFYNKLY